LAATRIEEVPEMDGCPCGSGRALDACCGPIVAQARTAGTAEELMRARYTAYATGKVEFLLASTHPDKRKDHDAKSTREWALNSEWHGLEILATTAGGPGDDEGTVEFVAEYTHDEARQRHHEVASFARHDGSWYLVGGRIVKPKPVVRETPKVGRNDPCPCGSGLKHKKCCGA
jgi:SEC-C motif-containing protein